MDEKNWSVTILEFLLMKISKKQVSGDLVSLI